MKSNKAFIAVVSIVLLGYTWVVLAIQNGSLLYQVHNFSPWLATGDYFWQSVSHPGGLREWVGDWLTQLFAVPCIGASVMVAIWGISAWLTARTTHLQHAWRLLALLPALVLMAGITQIGYWLFCLKAPSYWFGPTLGWLGVALGIAGFDIVCREKPGTKETFAKRWGVRSACYLLLFFVIGTGLLGWYATMGALLMLVMQRGTWRSRTGAVAAFLIACLLVLCLFHGASSIHWREPLLFYGFHHMIIPEAESDVLEWPFWGFMGLMFIMPLFAKISTRVQGRAAYGASLLLVISTGCLSSAFNYRNANFHAELRMLRQLEEGRWDEILDEMQHLEGRRPTRQMVMMKDVALWYTGRLGDEAFCYDYRGVRPQMNLDLPIHINHQGGPYFYYWLGMPNYAFVWCMENNIEYGLSPYYLRLMYRCALANGEKELARKYRGLLVGLPLDPLPSDETPAKVRQLMTGHDQLTNDRGYCEIYLMERLSQESYDTAEAQQLAVHYAMLMRSKGHFATALNRYCELKAAASDTEAASLPRHYQEAALFFSLDSVGTDVSIQKEYSQFCQQIEQLQLMGKDREQIGRSLWPTFGKTYWWYYDFCTDSHTY